MTDATSGSRAQNAVTGADLQTVTFTTSKGFGRGYDQHEVDSFVVRCAGAVDQLRAQLRDQDAYYRSEIARLQERIDRDSRSNEVAHAISVLTTAQQTADKTVAQADDYSARVMTEARDMYEDARRNAATLEQETEQKAKHVYDDALRRAETLQRETDEKVTTLTLSAVTAQQELDAQTAYLRTLRDATRTQMEAFLEGLLDHVADEYGKAHPMAAEAAQATTPRRVRRSNRTAGRSGSAAKSSNPAIARVAAKKAQRRAGVAGSAPSVTPGLPGQLDGGTQSHGIDEFLRD
jgi:DivIVA domain-containing protein